MTETEWRKCSDPDEMVSFLEGKVSERKFRLFACACCRRLWPHIKDAQSRLAIDAAERYADGFLSWEELETIFLAAGEAQSIFLDASWAVSWVACPSTREATITSTDLAADLVGTLTSENAKLRAGAAVSSGATEEERNAAWERYDAVALESRFAERREQAAVLREIVGNPFQPPADAVQWPSTVLQLAESLYRGADCAFALHDALLEAGQSEWAEHFRAPLHPKGCWALDAILGQA